MLARTRLTTQDVLRSEAAPAGAPPPFTRMPWDPTVTVCVLATAGLLGAAWLTGAKRRAG